LDARAKRAEQLDADVRSADQAYGTARIAFNFSWPTLLASAGLFVTNALSLSPVWSTIFSSMAEPMIAALLVSMPVSLLMVATGALVGLTLYLYIRKRALKKKRNELRAEQDGEYLHLDDVTRGT
jgi:membrane protein implicated in regulation of membrane protease activity